MIPMDTGAVELTIKVYKYMTKYMVEFVKDKGDLQAFNYVATDIITDKWMKDLGGVSPLWKKE